MEPKVQRAIRVKEAQRDYKDLLEKQGPKARKASKVK
jgi:hypothetical protein